MDIIRISNGDHERYEGLLLQRDHLEKEAFTYQQAYIREFGDLTVQAFRLKIDCISLKKSITFCTAAKNRGEKPDTAKLDAYLAAQMAAYHERLNEMMNERDAAQKGKPISFYEVGEIKKIYRRIAKMLHPDLSPLTGEYPELSDLFQRTMIAYQCNDLQELRDLEVLINRALEEKGIEGIEVDIPDLAQRILELESEIGRILSTEPYLYKDLLADAFRIQAKKEELTAEIEEYKAYKEQLEKWLRAAMEED